MLLYYPYHTFEHVLELLRQASFDPSVLAIKINIYRVAKDSRIIDSMIHAAHNGKKVTVVVELQARFDEEANIHWAKRLTEAGVHVIFSAPGLKIHAKLFLISRKENGEVVRYAHIGTGNFNEKTARLYTDYSLLTADARITNEVRRVFNFIENPYRPVTFDYLMVSPQNSRRLLYEMVDREIANAQQGLPSGITLKLNNLVDKGLVDRLYAASSSGVPVNLLVLGMCSLIPNLEGISDNIRAISIVDRYLEHDRVYIFENGGDKKVYLSSADWMTRNIDYRIEVATPRSISLKRCSHSAVSRGDCSCSGRTVIRDTASLDGMSCTAFLLFFRSKKPVDTSFSRIPARVAGVPRPLRSASSGISFDPAVSIAESSVSSVKCLGGLVLPSLTAKLERGSV